MYKRIFLSISISTLSSFSVWGVVENHKNPKNLERYLRGFQPPKSFHRNLPHPTEQNTEEEKWAKKLYRKWSEARGGPATIDRAGLACQKKFGSKNEVCVEEKNIMNIIFHNLLEIKKFKVDPSFFDLSKPQIGDDLSQNTEKEKWAKALIYMLEQTPKGTSVVAHVKKACQNTFSLQNQECEKETKIINIIFQNLLEIEKFKVGPSRFARFKSKVGNLTHGFTNTMSGWKNKASEKAMKFKTFVSSKMNRFGEAAQEKLRSMRQGFSRIGQKFSREPSPLGNDDTDGRSDTNGRRSAKRFITDQWQSFKRKILNRKDQKERLEKRETFPLMPGEKASIVRRDDQTPYKRSEFSNTNRHENTNPMQSTEEYVTFDPNASTSLVFD